MTVQELELQIKDLKAQLNGALEQLKAAQNRDSKFIVPADLHNCTTQRAINQFQGFILFATVGCVETCNRRVCAPDHATWKDLQFENQYVYTSKELTNLTDEEYALYKETCIKIFDILKSAQNVGFWKNVIKRTQDRGEFGKYYQLYIDHCGLEPPITERDKRYESEV